MLGKSSLPKLPNLVNGLALSFAAAEQGNSKAAKRAREAAYTESDLKVPEIDTFKITNLPYTPDKEQKLVKLSNKKEEEKKGKSFWDIASTALAAASFIPGADTVTNLLSIPVDLIKGDYVSAGLDALGMIPFLGEVADAAKVARKADDIADVVNVVKKADNVKDVVDVAKKADNIADAVKVGDKAHDVAKTTNTIEDFSDFSTTIHDGRQGKHIFGHNNYNEGKSIFIGTAEDAQNLINKHPGTGIKKGTNKEVVDFQKNIGKYVDPITGKSYDTTMGTIHYSKDGTHIVPARPKKFRSE